MGKQVAAGSNGGLAQLGEHLPCKQGVESSNLLVSIAQRWQHSELTMRTKQVSCPRAFPFICASYLENRILINLMNQLI